MAKPRRPGGVPRLRLNVAQELDDRRKAGEPQAGTPEAAPFKQDHADGAAPRPEATLAAHADGTLADPKPLAIGAPESESTPPAGGVHRRQGIRTYALLILATAAVPVLGTSLCRLLIRHRLRDQ